jgi:hypothetical protein
LRNGNDWMRIVNAKLSEILSALLGRGRCRRRRGARMKNCYAIMIVGPIGRICRQAPGCRSTALLM